MATRKKEATSSAMVVQEVTTQTVTFFVIGETSLVFNQVSRGAWRDLLFPKGRKNAAEKAATLKHDPCTEYRNSVYRMNSEAPTEIAVLATQFKAALCAAAIDVPGATKAQLGRLAWVEGQHIPLFGIPELFMAITRSADMNKTPDIRTRAIVPRWAAEVSITYIQPILTQQVIGSIFGFAGMTQGIGDWRQQKGSGNFGKWRLTSPDDPQYLEIVRNGGKQAQVKALEDPQCYDDQTQEVLAWFDVEIRRRGLKVA